MDVDARLASLVARFKGLSNKDKDITLAVAGAVWEQARASASADKADGPDRTAERVLEAFPADFRR
jgi:hypothetical protein